VPGICVSYLTEKSVEESREKNRNIQPETFGQNIYYLFNNSLCLQKGVMGAFASNKIIEALNKLKNLEKKLYYEKKVLDFPDQISYLEKMIDLIAEPLFKSQMKAYLAKCNKSEKEN